MSTAAGGARRRTPLLLLLPLIVFAALSGLFLIRLFAGEASILPSPLVGRPAPAISLPPLEGVAVPGLGAESLRGRVSLVNVWASWCGPCHLEHPQLMELARDPRLRVVGINYKDEAANARRFLGNAGNPFAAIGVDRSGRTAIDWGVYGVPETFLVGRDGQVLYKLVGPITPESLERELRPRIEGALAAS